MDLMGSRKHGPEFEVFVQLNGTHLLRTAFYLAGNRSVAEDLVQSALLATFTY
jgi:DNA-directed RNA polymerase specialized sigma24 family protein